MNYWHHLYIDVVSSNVIVSIRKRCHILFRIEITHALLILDDWVLGRVNSHPDLSRIEEGSQNMGLSVIKTKS